MKIIKWLEMIVKIIEWLITNGIPFVRGIIEDIKNRESKK